MGNRENLSIESSLKAYLLTAVKTVVSKNSDIGK